MTSSALSLVLGLGHRYRRDDAFGLELADRLERSGIADARIETHEAGEPILWERWSRGDRVLLLDAARDASPPGTLRVYDLLDHPPPEVHNRASSHGVGLIEAVELARALGRLPLGLRALTVSGADFSMGCGMSPDVEAALPDAEALVRELLTGGAPMPQSGRPIGRRLA